jgi:hypothetical protein
MREELKMIAKDAAKKQGKHEDAGLDGRYGKIGISAVAAALTVKCDAREKESAKPVISPRLERWLNDRAMI